jgi:predicted MFS family arabinose efflux permease
MKREPSSRTRPKEWIVPFAATLFAMLALQMSSLGFAPLLPAIQKDFGMSYSQVGLFTGIFGLSTLLLSVPAGLLAKWFGERKMLSAGLSVVALGLVLLGRAPNLTTAFAGRTLWLAGYQFAFISVMTAVALTCPASLRGSSMGFVGAMSSFASVVGAPFASVIENRVDWRGGILAFAAMGALGAVVFWAYYKRDPATAGPDEVRDSTRFQTMNAGREDSRQGNALRNPTAWALALLLGMCGMGGFTTTFFLPSAVKATFQLNALSAAYIISTGYVVAIFSNLLFGQLMDRFDKWKVMGLMMAILIPASFALSNAHLVVFWAAAVLVLAVGFSAANQVYTIAGSVLTGRETGNVMGVVTLGAGVFGYLGPQMIGWLRDRTGGFSAGWYLLGGVAALSLVEIFLLQRHADRRKRASAIAAA